MGEIIIITNQFIYYYLLLIIKKLTFLFLKMYHSILFI